MLEVEVADQADPIGEGGMGRVYRAEQKWGTPPAASRSRRSTPS
jgi:hypothetical protein